MFELKNSKKNQVMLQIVWKPAHYVQAYTYGDTQKDW